MLWKIEKAYSLGIQLSEVAQLAVEGGGNLNAFELSPTQILRLPPAVEPIGLHSLPRSFGHHRRSSGQADKPRSDPSYGKGWIQINRGSSGNG